MGVNARRKKCATFVLEVQAALPINQPQNYYFQQKNPTSQPRFQKPRMMSQVNFSITQPASAMYNL